MIDKILKILNKQNIIILGLGNILLTDEGFGIHLIEQLQKKYTFSENVSIIDGGVLGMNLLGIITKADYLIVVDAVRNNGRPGTIYRIDNNDIPERIRSKNSLHQIDFLEALTFCRYGFDKIPQAVILGVEPEDIETCSMELTRGIQEKIYEIIEKVLKEIERAGGSYQKRGV